MSNELRKTLKIKPSKSTIARVNRRLAQNVYVAKRRDFTSPRQRQAAALKSALGVSVWPVIL